MDETPARDGRTSVWHAEVADGPRPLPGAWLDQSKGRTGARRAQLQSQTRDCRAGRAGAAERVATSARLRRPVPNRPETGRHTSVAASSHTAWPVGPGGQNDTIVRLVAQKLSENLGQSYYVENQGGGSGNIGMGAAARAPADGYTILAAGGNFVINPSLYAKIPYHPVADFTPVTMLCSSPHVLAVHPSVPAVSVKELVALAQADPGKLSYASAGRGTPAHLAGELFRLAFGVDVTHVPFSGGGQAITSTIGGHTSMAVSAVPTAAPYIRGGNVRALAVMSATRTSVLPGVPTMAEAGRPLEADIVTGLLVRAGTPRAIVELLHREVVRVMAAPEVRERLV